MNTTFLPNGFMVYISLILYNIYLFDHKVSLKKVLATAFFLAYIVRFFCIAWNNF